METLRVMALALCLALAACAPNPETAPAPHPAPPAPRAPVVVAVVIDQLSAWIADERLRLLPPDGFFARLAREGTWVRALRYPYAITDTGPGHAALHTG